MAVMIPSSLKSLPDTTAGERKLFSLFSKILPDTCQVRYEVLLGERDRRPDYMLIDQDRGILIVEVKDWGVDSIRQATHQNFLVSGFGGSRAPKPVMNPKLKCEIYLREARSQLVAMPELRDSEDRLDVPVHFFVAFPNIRRHEFETVGLGKVVDLAHTLLREDLVSNGGPFLERYHQAAPKLEQSLTSPQMVAIIKALRPDILIPVVNTPDRLYQAIPQIVSVDAEVVGTYNLDLEQERIAKSLGEGPRLLRGLAGAGKTLIMLYRAKMLAANNDQIRILILCWNVSLGNYMRQIYDALQIEAHGTVVIQHFSEFVRELVKDRRRRDLDDPWFIRQLDSLRVDDDQKYDAIYIDEAQDFREDWISFLFHRLLKGEPKERNLLIAADDAQRIYHERGFSWSNLDIPMVGRSKILKTVYRNSARVWIFSALLLGREAGSLDEDASRVEFSSKGGKDPELIECESLEAQVATAVRIVRSLVDHGYAARNVLILYKQKRVNGYQLVEDLRRRLDEAQIPNDWIAEDREARQTFDWNAETVKISTVHSAKGMDSPIVMILGAETFQPKVEGRPVDDTKLMYVALTRAREYLIILYSGNEGLVPQLRYCHQEYIKHRDVLIEVEQGKR